MPGLGPVPSAGQWQQGMLIASRMQEKQHTIRKPVSATGIGLHTGNPVTLTLKPAPADSGILFKRMDLEDQPVLEARIENVVETVRGTRSEERRVGEEC